MGNVFEVTVHYEDGGSKRKSEGFWIEAKDDIAARKEAIRLARKEAIDTFKLLYCEITLAGTIDGHVT